jgi:hypothetical protein
MPELVRLSYRSICAHANGRPVILLTKENYKDYISIPDHVMEKLEKGAITITHFSNILRVSLLYEYGGIWLDATIFVTKPLPDFTGFEFYSAKRNKNNDTNVGRGRWSGYFLYARPHNLLFEFLRNFLFDYWQKHDMLPIYLLFDHSIAFAYDSIPDVKRMFDALPLNNMELKDLRSVLNDAYDSKIYNEITRETYIHKLTHKKEYYKLTEDGKLTFYGYICNTQGI